MHLSSFITEALGLSIYIQLFQTTVRAEVMAYTYIASLLLLGWFV